VLLLLFASHFAVATPNNDFGVALGVQGVSSQSKNAVIEVINEHPSVYFSLVNNKYFLVTIFELIIIQRADGTQEFSNPITGEPASVMATPQVDNYGNIVGADVFLPPAYVDFRSQYGEIVSHRGMVAHETRHAHQIALGLFKMATDLPDIRAAENDAQNIENKFTGLELDYYTDKHGSNARFFDTRSGKDIKQGLGQPKANSL